MKAGALIVSAGRTARHNAFDPMAKVGSISTLQRLIMTFRLAGVETVAVVIPGQDRKQLQSHAGRMGVVFLHSDDSQAEMFDNVCLGLRHLSARCGQILVTPVDLPLVAVETLQALLAAGEPLAVPVCEGRRGHPLLVGREAVPGILQYSGDGGLRGAVRQSRYPLVPVPVDDRGIFVRAAQAEEHRGMLDTHDLRRWRPVLKLQIARESVFFGPGSQQLLQMIGATGSVRLASQQMGISYSKAWNILNHLEEQLEHPVVDRQTGGSRGGKTELTPRGAELLRRFTAFEKESKDAVDKLFQRHFQQKGDTSHEID